jgi:hypothetical protein
VIKEEPKLKQKQKQNKQPKNKNKTEQNTWWIYFPNQEEIIKSQNCIHAYDLKKRHNCAISFTESNNLKTWNRVR